MSNKWIEEELEPGLRVNYRLTKILDTKQSKWQTVDLVSVEKRHVDEQNYRRRCTGLTRVVRSSALRTTCEVAVLTALVAPTGYP